jgi:hypothetical protein
VSAALIHRPAAGRRNLGIDKEVLIVHDHYVERVERTDGSGVGTGMVLGIIMVILVALIALFFLFGGPGRFAGTTSGGQTNVNVPGQTAPSTNSGPNINVPRQIDVNVNQQPSGGAPANSGAGNTGGNPGGANPGNNSGGNTSGGTR